jgi:hypothetical protein
LKKCQKCVEELKFCMKELFNNVFKVFSFLKFREVHFDLPEKKWKVYTRPTSASDFLGIKSPEIGEN